MMAPPAAVALAGFVDIQVNGYASVDFLAPLHNEQVLAVAQGLRRDGVVAILPTIITNERAAMTALLQGLRRQIETSGPEMLRLMPAFHIEGPCLSPEPGYRGAHNASAMRPASRDVFEPLLEAAGGPQNVAMVTLAPEVDVGLRTTAWLCELGIIVAIGHTNASLDVLREAEDAGASVFTHFGNGCPSMMPRHDNIIQRALTLDKIQFALIPDGHHVPWFALRNWIRWIGVDRCLFTTDCVSPAGGPPGRYTVGPYVVDVGVDGKVHPPGEDFLSGSSLTMPQAFDNAVRHLGLSEGDARRLCCDNPAKLISKWLPTRTNGTTR